MVAGLQTAERVSIAALVILGAVWLADLLAYCFSHKEKVRDRFHKASIAVFGLYVIFEGISLYYSWREYAALRSELKSQENNVSALTDQLGQSNTDLAQAKKKTGELQSELDRVKEPRRLTDAQKGKLISVLVKQDPVDVGTTFFAGDGESRDFTRDFVTLFKGLGWKVGESEMGMWNFISPGLTIEVQDAAHPPKQAIAFLHALQEVGIKATVSGARNYSHHDIHGFGISVGQK